MRERGKVVGGVGDFHENRGITVNAVAAPVEAARVAPAQRLRPDSTILAISSVSRSTISGSSR